MTAWMYVAGWTLLHFLWQGAAIAVAAAATLRLLRAASPQARYAVAYAALAAMLVAPAMTARLLVVSGRVATTETSRIAVPAPPSTAMRLAPAALRAIGQSHASPQATTSIDAFLPLVVATWALGVLLLLIRLAGGWRRVRSLHRASLAMPVSRWQTVGARLAARLNVGRAVHLVDSAHVDTPTLVGWLRPVILLPVAALATLTPSQIEAILVHELAHIRRHDYFVNQLQTLVETLFFYHPAVWWVSSRIRVEREHCCDDVAVEVCGDAVNYASALTELAAWRSGASGSSGLTGMALAATDGSLIARVRRVLGQDGNSARPVGGTTITTAFVLILIALAGALPRVPALSARATRQDIELRAAPAARLGSLTRNTSRSRLQHIGFQQPGGFVVTNHTVSELIRWAYQPMPVMGDLAWMSVDRCDLTATVPGESPAWELPALMRTILAGQFKLVTHTETRPLPVYALVLARADGRIGPGLRRSQADCAARGSGRPCGWMETGPLRQTVDGVTLPELAKRMSYVFGRALDRPIVDRTGLGGRFDMNLNFFPPTADWYRRFPGLATLLQPLGLPSVSTALQEQLGLRLDPQMAPGDVLVIDGAERPR